jgi:NDP-sugar pyrophosphorylase family protein
MKAIIVPAGKTEVFAPLTRSTPEFLLPVINKPIVEHLIELLFRHNVKEIILLLKHMPHETEKYFGDGSKWGCKISYALIKEYNGPISSLKHIQSRIDDSFLCLPWNILTSFNITSLIESHKKNQADISIAEPTRFEFLMNTKDFYPFIITPKALSLFESSPLHHNIDYILKTFPDNKIKVNRVASSFDFKIMHNMNEYFQINKYILQYGFNGINMPGNEMKPGVWIGRQVRIDPDAVISAPALIGNNCHIKRGVYIGKNTILGNNVIIGGDASIKGSIIFNGTYIGNGIEIINSIVNKNTLVRLSNLFNLFVKDDSILGDLDKKHISCKFESCINIITAILLLIILFPVMLFLFLYHLTMPSRNYLVCEKRNGTPEIIDHLGNTQAKEFNFFYFRSRFPLIKKLPGLLNVIRGEINLVGNPSLTAHETSLLDEGWTSGRLAPPGLFHSWEAEGAHNCTWEEKIISEDYYAATRSLKGDMKILFKTLCRFKVK